MDNVKEAFGRVKEDVDSLKYELNLLRSGLEKTSGQMIDVVDVLHNIKINQIELSQKIKELQELNLNLNTKIENQSAKLDSSTHNSAIETQNMVTPTQISTQNIQNPTNQAHISTQNAFFKPLNGQILGISTGNGGVPTDKQTYEQTNQQTDFIHKIHKNSVDNAAEMLDSLDGIKKEIRLKFKQLTTQELAVFCLIYQLDGELGYSDYKILASRLNLSESSIRDYVGRIIKKGVPVDKNKINNKSIQLSISQNLKKIASLQTILQLRDL